MKKILALVLALVLALGLVACGEAKPVETDPAAEGDKVITVGASSTPHAEILESVKAAVAEKATR